MADLPGFLNKSDFYGKVLSGYIAVIISIFLFWPDYFFQLTKSTEVSADIFTAVVFLVAGPALGYTLFLFHRYLYTIRSALESDTAKKNDRATFIENYYTVRTFCSDAERQEIDQTEAEEDFSISTGIALLVIDIFYVTHNFDLDNLHIKLGLLFGSIFLFLSTILHNKESYSPLINILILKYC